MDTLMADDERKPDAYVPSDREPLPSGLIPAERMCLTMARTQLERGDNPPRTITTVLVMAIDRLLALGLGDEADAVRLLEEALHLRMNGERAPGGNETWRDWDRKAEAFLRARLDRLHPELRDDPGLIDLPESVSAGHRPWIRALVLVAANFPRSVLYSLAVPHPAVRPAMRRPRPGPAAAAHPGPGALERGHPRVRRRGEPGAGRHAGSGVSAATASRPTHGSPGRRP